MIPEQMLASLNPAQKEAVSWPAKPLLILAGAGSGKTRILTHRIAFLVGGGVQPFNILGVTFTNKAAGEMRSRVQKLVRQDVWISTFHSSCLKILRSDGCRMELDRNFSIYDDADQLALIKECIKELNMNEKLIHPKGLRERIQRAKDYLMTPYQYAEHSEDLYEESVAKIYRLYEEKMARFKALDFGDLIMKTVLLFDRSPETLEHWQDRFRHILIDEYQDTNHAQYRLVKQLASRYRQITVVGDPDQSIYAWRGADIRNILNFENDYPEAGIIKMEQNYRSTPVVLEAANELIKRNRFRKPKALWTEREGGEKISLFQAADEKEEARYVVHHVMRYREEGRPLADQVIFYRMHAQSRAIEDMLRKANIPYKIVGGIRFYDRREIKDLIAYLKAVAYPSDDLSLKRIMNVPARGIGKKALAVLEKKSLESHLGLDAVLREVRQMEELQPKARQSLLAFHTLIGKLRQEKQTLSVSDLLGKILEKTGYLLSLESEKTAESQDRIENIEEFFTVIRDYEDERRGQSSSLEDFLESISLVTDLDQWDQGTNVLTLMTYHMAKGLEFPIVYMIGLEEGVFPLGNIADGNSGDLEEERRLCYVGLTRAKEKLHLIYASQRRIFGSTQHNLPSRFLNEIPSRLYDTMSYFCQDTHSEMENHPDDDIFVDYDRDEIKRRILFD